MDLIKLGTCEKSQTKASS